MSADAGERKHQETRAVARLASILGACLSNDGTRAIWLVNAGGGQGFRADICADPGGSGIRLDLRYVPVDLAARICKMLREATED